MGTNAGSEEIQLPNCCLPGIIVTEILLRLPVKPLLRFRAVCKPWCDFLTSRDFALMYLHHQLGRDPSTHSLLVVDGGSRSAVSLCSPPTSASNEDEVSFSLSKTALPFPFDLGSDYANDYRIDGSCNGLVCVSLKFSPKIVIWNPATIKYRLLNVPEADGSFEVARPELALFKGTKLRVGVPANIGFGFAPETNDYKLLRVWISPGFLNQPNSFWVWVYAFSTGSWKLLDVNFKYELRSQKPAVVNGSMHWYESETLPIILVFDTENEVFRTMAVPDIRGSIARQLVCINSCLSLVVFDGCGSDFDIWVLSDYGNEASWLKRFTVRDPSTVFDGWGSDVSMWFLSEYGNEASWLESFTARTASPQLVGCWKSQMLLFQKSQQLLSYDLFSGKFECLGTLKPRAASIVNYFESLEPWMSSECS